MEQLIVTVLADVGMTIFGIGTGMFLKERRYGMAAIGLAGVAVGFVIKYAN
jgi:hypothetical protein